MVRLRLIGVGAFVCCLLGCSAWSALAYASEPSTYAPDESEFVAPAPASGRPVCPEPPEPAGEGADASVLESRAARIEADQACSVYADRLESLSERLWWIVSEQLRQHLQGEHLLESVAPLHRDLSVEGAVAESLRGEVVSELQVLHRDLGAEGVLAERLLGGGGVEEATEGVQASVDAGAEATRSALWYLIGLAAGAFVGYVFYRQVMPRA